MACAEIGVKPGNDKTLAVQIEDMHKVKQLKAKLKLK